MHFLNSYSNILYQIESHAGSQIQTELCKCSSGSHALYHIIDVQLKIKGGPYMSSNTLLLMLIASYLNQLANSKHLVDDRFRFPIMFPISVSNSISVFYRCPYQWRFTTGHGNSCFVSSSLGRKPNSPPPILLHKGAGLDQLDNVYKVY